MQTYPPKPWYPELVRLCEDNLRVMRQQLEDIEPGSSEHISTVWCIKHTEQHRRRLVAEMEGRLHEATYPKVIN